MSALEVSHEITTDMYRDAGVLELCRNHGPSNQTYTLRSIQTLADAHDYDAGVDARSSQTCKPCLRIGLAAPDITVATSAAEPRTRDHASLL